jgi:mannosyltransferase OCH1-like enzyme
MLKETTNDIPKIIWFMWLQGFDNAPILVKKCYDLWVKYNRKST